MYHESVVRTVGVALHVIDTAALSEQASKMLRSNSSLISDLGVALSAMSLIKAGFDAGGDVTFKFEDETYIFRSNSVNPDKVRDR